MPKAFVVFAALFLIVGLGSSGPMSVQASENGGAECAACTLAVGLVEQSMQLKNLTAKEAVSELCSFLPKPVDSICNILADVIDLILVPLIDAGETPDVVCNAMKICKDETAVCRLFPSKKRSDEEYKQHVHNVVRRHQKFELRSFNICTILPGVCEIEDHKPFFDSDGDDFSSYETLRGADWRGKDCDDLDATVFPGRDTSDEIADKNCNGIYGVDSATGKSYEELWCQGTGAMGVAALGDSATAHFRIPADYVTASKLSKATFAHIVRNLENELDWPMLSWSTGHLNTSEFTPDIPPGSPMHSLYSKMLERNRCNHRDFQNLGVNGAKAENLYPFDQILARNKSQGVKPLLTVFSMVGNDVCNGHHTFNTMTTPNEYHAEVKKAVLDADSFLPAGSHIVLVPLVDGRVLYNTMHDRIHPIGKTNNDVTYADLYSYLNCLDVSPCWGWMNTNETVRNTTWKIASSLNAELPKIVEEVKNVLVNTKVHYLGNVFDTAISNYPGPLWEIIEPVDGFHPSQWGNSYIGETLFNMTLAAGIQPPVNPHNQEIASKFGNQGGY